MGIIQEKKAIVSQEPEKKEERTLKTIRFKKEDVPVIDEENKNEDVVEEPANDGTHIDDAEQANVSSPSEGVSAEAPAEKKPRKKSGRPKKNAKK